ncbi:MAG: Gfo/Idh/MocA family oxidoreductase [Oscillospiraceae bacterium]|nr:Gfo/Idh/MocA family oxidoreductase [Oscillospiraceae bacterium]
MSKVKLAVIGLGCRGFSVLKYVLLKIKDAEIVSVCDVYEDRIDRALNTIKEAGGEAKGFTDYKEALNVAGIQGVCIFTSWQMHSEISTYAMEKGIPVGSEVGCEFSLEGCFDVVKTQERTKTPYMFVENCCYGKDELLATNMARKGLFGSIVHCSGSYSHDLREEVVFGKENRHYRFDNYVNRNCDNYPTHELGPIAKLLNINRGNRIVAVSSMASKAMGMHEYVEKIGKEKEIPAYLYNTEFKQGDIIDTLIKCANGETIRLKLDTNLPRQYSRDFTVRGTKGLYEQATNTVYLDGDCKEEIWEPAKFYREFLDSAKKYEDEYLPKIWREISEEDKKAGHGGMDYFAYNAFVDCIKNKKPMPIDVYDGAVWMAVSVLSEQSIIQGGAAQYMPDFTAGKWMTRPSLDVIDWE